MQEHDFTNRPIQRIAPSTIGWEKEYKSKLPTALRAAGWFIQKYFQDRNISFPRFRWIQTNLTYPAFQHLCFAIDGNIYSVLIELVGSNSNQVLDRDVRNQIKECRDNDLIPCSILLRQDSFEPLVDGTHLINTETRIPILKFEKREGNVRMSAWEINNLGVSIVIQQLEKEGKKILAMCDVLNIEPQIWFEDEHGKRCYVIVKTVSGSTKENVEYKVNHELVMKFIDYDGYYAEVGVSPADVAYDENDQVVPLSERFSSENPKEILFRDKGFYINYRGLQFIERRAADKGVEDKELYNI